MSVYEGLFEREGVRGVGVGKGGGGYEQTLWELLLHFKHKKKQSGHLPNPKGLPFLTFLRVVCVYLMCFKKFHTRKSVVL